MGFCEGSGAWRINAGRFGDVALDGLAFGVALKFPGAMHKGNGTLCLMIDDTANAEQREALLTIASGAAGGMPFEILKMLFTKLLPPVFVPFDFHLDDRNSSVAIGDVLSFGFEPIKNPVTGAAESVRIEHATGFIFKGAECVSAKENQLTLPDWSFSYPNKAGFVTKVRYGN
jgi:hypothetical protein